MVALSSWRVSLRLIRVFLSESYPISKPIRGAGTGAATTFHGTEHEKTNASASTCVHIIFQPILPRPLRLFSDNGWPQSAIALSGGVQGGNNAVIDAVLARSRRYGAPARGITLKVSCQRNATKPSADDSSPEKDTSLAKRGSLFVGEKWKPDGKKGRSRNDKRKKIIE